jgi:hypothetical protein
MFRWVEHWRFIDQDRELTASRRSLKTRNQARLSLLTRTSLKASRHSYPSEDFGRVQPPSS